MFRPLVTIAAVAALSCLVASLERGGGSKMAYADPGAPTWIRTIDGWEPSTVVSLEPRPLAAPALDPRLVAVFQLTASLLALLAFPTATARSSQKLPVIEAKKPSNSTRRQRRLQPTG